MSPLSILCINNNPRMKKTLISFVIITASACNMDYKERTDERLQLEHMEEELSEYKAELKRLRDSITLTRNVVGKTTMKKQGQLSPGFKDFNVPRDPMPRYTRLNTLEDIWDEAETIRNKAFHILNEAQSIECSEAIDAATDAISSSEECTSTKNFADAESYYDEADSRLDEAEERLEECEDNQRDGAD
jgi:hypothetical protein